MSSSFRFIAETWPQGTKVKSLMRLWQSSYEIHQLVSFNLRDEQKQSTIIKILISKHSLMSITTLKEDKWFSFELRIRMKVQRLSWSEFVRLNLDLYFNLQINNSSKISSNQENLKEEFMSDIST